MARAVACSAPADVRGQVALATGVIQTNQAPEEAMSAVSAEFSHASAPSGQRPDDQASDGAVRSSPQATTAHAPDTDFGPNEWLVDELYQRYLSDPGSVDRAWWNFFADYRRQPTDQARSPRATAAPTAGAPPPV